MDWVELVLPAGTQAEEVGALLPELVPHAKTGVEVRGEDVVFWVLASAGQAALESLQAVAARMRDAGLDVDPQAAHLRPAMPEDEWRDAWKRYFRVTRLTDRIVVVPSWEKYEAAPGDVVLDLDLGRAFGTGAHATTRLCLLLLDRLATRGGETERDGTATSPWPRCVLDVGTGSGILAIAAAKLWPHAAITATDVDPTAVEVTKENASINQVTDRIRIQVDDARKELGASDVAGEYDVVTANIRATVLDVIAGDLAACVAPGGCLVLSGLLSDEAPVTRDLYVREGLVAEEILTLPDDPDWSAVLLSRP